VAGTKIAAIGNTNCRPGQQTNKNTGECCKYQGPNLPSGQCPRAPGGAPAVPAPVAPGAPAPINNPGSPDDTSTPNAPAPPPVPACQNAVGKCRSGCQNNAQQCCKANTALVNGCCGSGCNGGASIRPNEPRTRTITRQRSQVPSCAGNAVRNSRGTCVPRSNPNPNSDQSTVPPSGIDTVQGCKAREQILRNSTCNLRTNQYGIKECYCT
jgi:hypothetical protein